MYRKLRSAKPTLNETRRTSATNIQKVSFPYFGPLLRNAEKVLWNYAKTIGAKASCQLTPLGGVRFKGDYFSSSHRTETQHFKQEGLFSFFGGSLGRRWCIVKAKHFLQEMPIYYVKFDDE